MNIKRITLDDYEEICKWWKAQNRVILSWEVLPTLGFIVCDENEKLAVSWLYCSDSVTGFVAWTTQNPDAPIRKVRDAIKLLEETVEVSGKMAGLKILFQFSGGGGFSRLLLKSGWKNSMIKHDFLLKEI